MGNVATDRAKAKLVHWFEQLADLSADEAAEIGSIVDDLVAACRVEVEQQIRQLQLDLLPRRRAARATKTRGTR